MNIVRMHSMPHFVQYASYCTGLNAIMVKNDAGIIALGLSVIQDNELLKVQGSSFIDVAPHGSAVLVKTKI